MIMRALQVFLVTAAVTSLVMVEIPAAHAAGIPSAPKSATPDSAAKTRDQAVVKTTLVSKGVATAQAERQLAKLSRADLQRLAQNPSQIQVGGMALAFVWIGIVLLIAVIFWLIEGKYTKELETHEPP